jgi:hypothetical protein
MKTGYGTTYDKTGIKSNAYFYISITGLIPLSPGITFAILIRQLFLVKAFLHLFAHLCGIELIPVYIAHIQIRDDPLIIPHLREPLCFIKHFKPITKEVIKFAWHS